MSANANPLLLPVATTGQVPLTAAYDGLNVPGLASGASYLDPTTAVKIYKLTSPTFPVASPQGFIHDYAEGSQEISLPHTGTTRTILVRDRQTLSYWLLDFTPGVGVGNPRQLTGNAIPTADIRFTFSTNAATPYFAYCAHFEIIRRYDVRTLLESPGGGWPVTEPVPYEFGWPVWLQQSADDGQFVWMLGNGPNVVSYIPGTGTRVERANIANVNEPRLDRAGRYVAVVQSDNAMQLWDTQTNTLTWSLPGDPGVPFGHAANLSRQFRGWQYNQSFPYPLYKLDPSSAADSVVLLSAQGTLPGVPQHSSGNWIQPNVPVDDQWSLTHYYGSVTPAAPPSGSYLAPGAMVFVTAAGQRRTLGHPYNATTDASGLAFAKLSADGHYVLFTSDMNGAGRLDLFLAEVPSDLSVAYALFRR